MNSTKEDTPENGGAVRIEKKAKKLDKKKEKKDKKDKKDKKEKKKKDNKKKEKRQKAPSSLVVDELASSQKQSLVEASTKKNEGKKEDKKRRRSGSLDAKKGDQTISTKQPRVDNAINATKSHKEEDGHVEAKSFPNALESQEYVDPSKIKWTMENPRPMAESSALPAGVTISEEEKKTRCLTLLLFYQYVEPPWNEEEYQKALKTAEQIAKSNNLSGRMRVAREGFNCTLTSTTRQDMYNFCQALRAWKPEYFCNTEFKLTHDLPMQQAFNGLKIIPVIELVHYGLEGAKAPAIQRFSGTHLEPALYHQKIAEPNTVIIDVRNHYEAAIGRFQPPAIETSDATVEPPKYVDPMMRKSTEFPVWLDHPDTLNELKGKQVLMFCTGGIRCERASALLKYKMETDPIVKDLDIKGVYQLQGGIDKYFKEFPDGGYWKGKNYVFDKRFAHAPPEKEPHLVGKSAGTIKPDPPMAKCQACNNAWDKYRGKRRCPTCGVPSLVCRECLEKNPKISIRCDMCVQQDIRSKKDLRTKELQEIKTYEERCKARGVLLASQDETPAVTPNPDQITKLFLRNMCRKFMTEEVLLEKFPGITHIVWRMDRKNKDQFLGQGWVEMESPEAAAAAVARSGEVILGRPLYISYQKPDGKDAWPPPNSAIRR